MKRSPLLSLCVGALLLSGCLHTAASPQAAAQTLTPVHTEELPMTAKFLEFSGNGRSFIVAGAYRFVHLRDATTFEKLVALKSGGELSAPDRFDNVLATQGAGYIDDNTWYFATFGDNIAVSIREIEPPRELFKHNLVAVADRPVIVNKNHLAYVETLLNWHDGTSYPVDQAHLGWLGYTLVGDSQVMTYNPFSGHILFHDPVKQEKVVWDTGSPIQNVIVSADARYALATSRQGKCGLWQLPEKEQLGSCGRGGLGGKKWSWGAFQRDSRAVAVAADNKIWVYATQPFKLLMKAAMPERVTGLALSEGRLAAADNVGNIRAWDITENRLLGEHPGDPENGGGSSVLAFQPGGSRLAVSQNNQLLVFELR